MGMELDVFEWSCATDRFGLEFAREILEAWRREGWELIGGVLEGRLAEDQWWILARPDTGDV